MSRPPLSDGWHIQEIYIEAMGSSKWLWNIFPETRAGLMSCIVAAPGLRENLRALKQIIILIFGFLSPSNAFFPKCDVILYSSSNKPSNRPALIALAKKLNDREISCGVLTPTDFIFSKTDCSNIITKLHHCNSFMLACSSVAGSLLGLLSLLVCAIPNKKFFFHLLPRFFCAWNELAHSRARFAGVKDFLDQTSAKIVLTHNEKIPVASELIFASLKRNIKTVLFLCEHPDVLAKPVLSDELWVWDDSIKTSMKARNYWFENISSPNIEVVGHPESDFVTEKKYEFVNFPKMLNDRINDRKVFVFISEYVENKTWDRGPVTSICLNWLIDVAIKCPDWFFLFKTRPLHHNNLPPQLSVENWPENILICRDELELNDILASDRVFAAGALGSLGLYCSARVGIPSFRFNVSDRQMKMDFLDEITFPINNSEQLFEALKEKDCLRAKLPVESVKWQHRGDAIQQMEILLLKLLHENDFAE